MNKTYILSFLFLSSFLVLTTFLIPFPNYDREPAEIKVKKLYTLADYAQECEEALGEIPEINCLEGEVIPMTNSDLKSGEATPITFENYHDQIKCDRPSLLRNEFINKWGGFNPCVPYMRVKKVENKDTTWMWTCRRYYIREENNPKFDDINMVGYNHKTGGTCFFVNHINRDRPSKPGIWSKILRRKADEAGNIDFAANGTTVPPIRKNGITTPEALAFWSSPKSMSNTNPLLGGGSFRCILCHDNGPFIQSPYIHQMKDKNGDSLVPSVLDGPYNIIGSQYFNEWKLKYLVSPEADDCTSCHKIGNQRSCGEFAQYAVGLKPLPHLTDTFKNKAWMPQNPGEADWDAHKMDEADIKAVEFINFCCKNPKDPKCKWEDGN